MAQPNAKTEMIGKTIINQYVIRKHLGGGSFGDVFEAENIQTHKIVALKFETGASSPQLPNEYKMYQTLAGMDGIPTVYGLYDYGKSRVMAMDQMGPSLERLFKRCGRKFSLKTVLMIADQLFRIIEWVHECGVLHRDIKPHNFLTGRGEYANKIYLIDYGISSTYLDARTHEHLTYSQNNGLVGTPYFVSVNTHLGGQQSRRDDIEGILYMLVLFLQGSLPWQGDKRKGEKRNEEIAQIKIQTKLEVLCAGIPDNFRVMLDIVRRLRFDERPKYVWFRSIFTAMMLQNGFTYDSVFDWDENAAIHSPMPSVFLIHSSGEFQRSNERQVKVRKEKLNIPEARPVFFWA
jgi:serine/threonine protein kinase